LRQSNTKPYRDGYSYCDSNSYSNSDRYSNCNANFDGQTYTYAAG